MLRCVRCQEWIPDSDDVPAIDFRTDGLVCPLCHNEEVESRPRYAVVPNSEEY